MVQGNTRDEKENQKIKKKKKKKQKKSCNLKKNDYNVIVIRNG